MTLKLRIELIFFGVVITSVIFAILSLMIATHGLLSDDEFGKSFNPVHNIPITQTISKNSEGHYGDELRMPVSDEKDDILEFGKARILLKNLDTEQGLIKAHDLLIAATQVESAARAEAAFELGTIYRMFPTDECQKVAFVWFRKSAEWGFRKGHLELAKAYRRGLGVLKDYDLSVHHYRTAAIGGSAAGALELINLKHQGMSDTPGDIAAAKATLKKYLPMLERSAGGGDARAARTIGRLYLSGNLLNRDLKLAENWLVRAAQFGDAAAMHDLAFLKLDQRQIADPQEIISRFKKSAALNYSGSMTALGRLHLNEQFGLLKSGSISWFEQGAAAGHAGSMEELARIYLNGSLVEKDIGKAREYALRGVKQKHDGSVAILAEIDKIAELKVAVKE